MRQMTCHDTFAEAQLRRRSHPLKAGADKLREARHRLSRMMKTIDAIRDYLREPNSLMAGAALGSCCMTDDKAYWLKNLPKQMSAILGYDILPAVAVLTAEENIAETDITAEQANVRARAKQLLMDCEAQRVRLKGGINREYAAIKSGRSELYDLLVDADRIAQSSLELIAGETW